ncbi:hypothetical protein Daus18300_006584 [Diaporthe australafricana]|uniref:Uncharacterized protein n=1 Tax=Diaporthe australafricana TaxID=127596 RepID=A0ABR3WT76_9PEZI
MPDPSTGAKDDRLFIALDFGTTYSGVSYAYNIPGKKPEVVFIMKWPGITGQTQPKVPTLIWYDPNDPSKFKWGGEVTWRDPAVHGVKLLLDPDQPMPDYLPASSFENDRKALPKDLVDVAADYIGAIYKHALSVIESAGVREYFHFCQKEFVLSVPAVWSDKAMDLTLKAAKKAGIHPVNLIKEPEAAALYTFSSHNHSINVGDSFVLCDAGGGTVDLITYETKKVEPYLELAELVPGSGGMAGSLGLNKRFEDKVQQVVGDAQFACLKQGVGWAKGLHEFDKDVKTSFNGKADVSFFVSFPNDVVRDMFEPVIKDVLRLVDAQVEAALSKRAGLGLKGEELIRDRKIKFPFQRILRERYNPVDLLFKDTLRYSEVDVAPIYPCPSVKVCCKVRSDLRGIDKTKLVKITGADGKVYHEVNYHLVLSTDTANLKFSLEFDGVEMGSVEATYV